ncbi:MAG TPA: sigma-54 dependent transcriptional regulator [Bacteroidales bacterium]|nr:sigma-54 dependent transcriptional regulator [Bacteroidales bacterium]
MENKITVLVIDDERSFTEEMQELLQNTGFKAFVANTARQGLNILKTQEIDLLILDIRLPGVNGLDILKEVKGIYPKMEVIIVSAHGDMESVIRAMRLGALDYLRKPFRHVDFQIAIERTQKFLDLNRKIQVMEEKNSLISKSLGEKVERDFIGESQKIQEVLGLAMTASEFSDTNVLITGESGTGKENIARIIHYSGKRKDNLFCAVNSSAITETLLESEFFGHKKGSFTGAITDKKGFFEVTDQGTLFLDEIGDMPFSLQAKILRAIEEKKITRVGETEQIKVNFRVIAATNHDIEQLVSEKKFRLDLIHRLNTLHIHIPPLRERTEDVEPLLKHFVSEFSVRMNKPHLKIDKNVVGVLKKYQFPGNVRELKNMTERAVILSKGDLLTVQDFPLKTGVYSSAGSSNELLTMQEQEVRLLRQALRDHGYNQKAAADALGITRDSLIRRMKKHNIRIKKED